MDDLSGATLERANGIVRTEFTPPALASRFTRRLCELLKRGAAMGSIFETSIDGRRCAGAGAWVFLQDHVYARFRSTPRPSFDEWLVDDVLTGDGVLTREEIARANADAGLHLFVLFFRGEEEHLSEAGRMELVQEMRTLVFPGVLGYRLRSLSARIRHLSQVASAEQSGCRVIRADAEAVHADGDYLRHPVLVHAEREWVHFASWIAGAFAWHRPIFGFSAAEQRLLALAMRGHRDEAISSICGVGASTVKKRWDSILARAAAAAPDLFDVSSDAPPGRRGREKRTRLLGYLATHLQELRPYQK